MNNVYVSLYNIDKLKWKKKFVKFCKSVLKYKKIRNWEISILFCDDEYIQYLNKEYRKKDEPTDVLSFCQEKDINIKSAKYYAGDIVISIDTLKKNSEYFNVDENEELKRLAIHGILHLYGMDHEDNLPEREMLKQQEEILEYYKGVKLI